MIRVNWVYLKQLLQKKPNFVTQDAQGARNLKGRYKTNSAFNFCFSFFVIKVKTFIGFLSITENRYS